MRAYAQKAEDRELVWWAAELKLDAERKAGRMLAEMADSGERESQGGDRAKSHAATLGDYDITKSQSSRWQAVGAVTDEDYEAWKGSLKGESFPTSAGLRNFAKRQAAEQKNGPWRTDAVADLAVLAKSGQQFAAICADPPWSFKVYSGKGKSR